jgi:signal transduction histidine kinase
MYTITSLFAIAAFLAVGMVILWANPRKLINRVVSSCALHVSVWQVLQLTAVSAENGLFWYRWTVAVGALFPAHLWVVKQVIVAGVFRELRSYWKRAAFWIIVPVLLAGLCFTQYFVPAHSTGENRVYGFAYYAYIPAQLILYALLVVETYLSARSLSGVRRLEMQLWLGGGVWAGISIVLLMAFGGWLRIPGAMMLRPLIVLSFFAVAAFGITTSRVFDAKHLLLAILQKLILVCVVAGCAFVVHEALVRVLPGFVGLIATTGVALLIAAELNQWLDGLLKRYPRASEARSKALAIAMQEMRQEPLKDAFTAVLRGWSRSDAAYILTESEGTYAGRGWSVPAQSKLIELLQELRWVSIERLARERETVDRIALRDLMEAHSVGAMVLSRGPAFNILVAVGTRPSRRPFTYPEVQQLMELASIFQTALARSFLWSKAQRAEQLATVGMLGASVAHEIRNPLVTIKSFVHLLPQHYDDRTFRERFFRLIGEEVGRIDRLTEQLLDLASPRHYDPVPTSLHQVIISSLDLVATKADERRVVLHRDLQAVPDTVVTDANAARQVLLNLCFNGIQAQDQANGDRWVRVSTRNASKGIELCVADNGPGIPNESRSHLFQAFHSTKSSGFGLGLVICHEILSSLDAAITVDPFVPGEGARFRIVFPCPQPTS